MMEFYTETYHKARKPHKCDCCFKVIVPGERYLYQSGKWDGSFFTRAWCEDCADIANWYFSSDYNFNGEEFDYDWIDEAACEEFCAKCAHGSRNNDDCNLRSIWHCRILLTEIRKAKGVIQHDGQAEAP